MRDDELAVRRGFVIEWPPEGCRQFRMSTAKDLDWQLQLVNASPVPRILVLPGHLDEATKAVFSKHHNCVTKEFLDAHAWSGSCIRPKGCDQDDGVTTCHWVFPQTVPDGYRHANAGYATSRGTAVLLSASLCIIRIPILIIERSSSTSDETPEPLASLAFEDEIRYLLPQHRVGMLIEDYVNQLAYERWADFVTALRPRDMTQDMLFAAMGAMEQNLDQVRYLFARGRRLNVAGEDAWADMLLRLQRRIRVMTLVDGPLEAADAGETGVTGVTEETEETKETGETGETGVKGEAADAA